MKNSSLLNAVIRGKWFILNRSIDSQLGIVDKLLERQYTDDKFSTILSEREKIQLSIAGTSTKMSSGDSSFDNVPKDSTAIFCISGTMLKYGSYCSYGTMEVADAIREAVDSGKFTSLIYDIDSGGGSVDAIAPLIDVTKYAQSKGIAVIALVDLCASAAYYFACQCDEIIAGNSISAEIGSIGVMMSFRTNKKQLEAAGIEDHVVYSDESDWKNKPFMNAVDALPTPETRYDLLKSEELNPLAIGFKETVKSLRPNLNLDIEGIISGRMFFAQQAKEYGLIDHVGDMNMAISHAKSIRNKNIANSFINQ